MHDSARTVISIEKGDSDNFIVAEMEDGGCMQCNWFLDALVGLRGRCTGKKSSPAGLWNQQRKYDHLSRPSGRP
jgi:hypothetical protein